VTEDKQQAQFALYYVHCVQYIVHCAQCTVRCEQ